MLSSSSLLVCSKNWLMEDVELAKSECGNDKEQLQAKKVCSRLQFQYSCFIKYVKLCSLGITEPFQSSF